MLLACDFIVDVDLIPWGWKLWFYHSYGSDPMGTEILNIPLRPSECIASNDLCFVPLCFKALQHAVSYQSYHDH